MEVGKLTRALYNVDVCSSQRWDMMTQEVPSKPVSCKPKAKQYSAYLLLPQQKRLGEKQARDR